MSLYSAFKQAFREYTLDTGYSKYTLDTGYSK